MKLIKKENLEPTTQVAQVNTYEFDGKIIKASLKNGLTTLREVNGENKSTILDFCHAIGNCGLAVLRNSSFLYSSINKYGPEFVYHCLRLSYKSKILFDLRTSVSNSYQKDFEQVLSQVGDIVCLGEYPSQYLGNTMHSGILMLKKTWNDQHVANEKRKNTKTNSAAVSNEAVTQVNSAAT